MDVPFKICGNINAKDFRRKDRGTFVAFDKNWIQSWVILGKGDDHILAL